MAATSIEWADFTFNHVSGCSKVSPGCANCYAETHYSVKIRGVKWGPNGNRIVKAESGWKEPLKWNRDAASQCPCSFPHPAHDSCDGTPLARRRPRVFCASLADVFEDWQGPMLNAQEDRLYRLGEHWCSGVDVAVDICQGGEVAESPLTMSDVRTRLFRLIEATPNLDWLLLTKRPENITKLWPATARDYYPNGWPNVWLGVSVEDQERADERIPHLLATPAAVRFLSVEPLLGPVDLSAFIGGEYMGLGGPVANYNAGLSWVIVGGESGQNARQAHLEWFRSIIRQCKDAGVAVFMKQTGQCVLTGRSSIDKPSVATQAVMLKDAKGGDPSEWPEDLRVREFPNDR